MATALSGKCVGLLVLALIFYSCCYAFRVREHLSQTSSVSEEQIQRGTVCTSIFGRCPEKTIASSGRKWHDTRLASGARKPPVGLMSSDDDDRDTGGARVKFERTGRSADRFADAKASGLPKNVVTEEDEDAGDVIVEVEEDVEDIINDQEVVEDSDYEDDAQDGGEEIDEDVENDEEEKQSREVKEESEDEDDGDGEEETEDSEESSIKLNERIKIGRTSTKIIQNTVKQEGKSGKEKKVSSERRKEVVEFPKKVKNVKEDVESEDNEDEDDEDEDDEDEDDEEEESLSTPPPKKLEIVRHADKDKVRSAEFISVIEKPKLEVKQQSKLEKKPSDTLKEVTESSLKKLDEKKSTEGPKQSIEATKKVEPVKTTKSESEPLKAKIIVKSEEKLKIPVKPQVSKTQDQVKPEMSKTQPVKKSEKTKAKASVAQTAPTKIIEVKRSDKDESKAKRKTHVDSSFTLAQLNDILLRVPTFVPNFTAVENVGCKQHGKIFLRQLRGYKLWALQMLDASAKIPSGLLRGNANQFGDFDECLGVKTYVKFNDSTVKVQGKYCLASIDLHASHPSMKLPVNMMQARALIKGSIRDPGYFIPKFTTVNWALCLPAACSAEDAENVLQQALSDYNSTAGIKFTINIDPDMCYVKQKARSYSKETIGVLYFYAMIICLVAVATIRDYLVESEEKGNYSERIIMSFSLRRTTRLLFKQATSQTDISCIHGIRVLTTMILYVGHQMIPLSRLPFSNRIEFTEVTNVPLTSVLRASAVYTDVFLLLSGVLTAYNMAHEFLTRGEIRWFCRFIARYIRLTPALLVVVFWYAFVMEHIGWGPQWNSIMTPNAELCKRNAWTNLLYIQNFFSFEEMCASHTHQLALDMQLSLLAPMLVFFLECRPIVGILVIVFFVLLSATLRYIATMTNHLSLVVFHGISIKHLYRTANLTYVLPLHRATPYVFGVGLGVLLRYTGRKVKLHKVLVILGWLIAMALGSWALFSPWHSARRDYVYSVEEATNYAVISPVLWALALCWFIFACYTNHGGLIDKFLSNYWFLVFSKISYAVYLTQFAVFFYNVGTTRYSSQFQLHRAIDPLEAGTVIIVSTVLTLVFDLPMQEIKNVLMESTDIFNVELVNNEKLSGQIAFTNESFVKDGQIEEKKVLEEDRIASTNEWNWQGEVIDGSAKLSKESDEEIQEIEESRNRGRMVIAHEDDDDYRNRGRRSRSSKRFENDGSDLPRMSRELEEIRGKRSLSKSRNVKGLSTRDSENEEEYLRRRQLEENEDEEDENEELENDLRRYRRSQSRGRSVMRESDDYRSWEFVDKERSSSRGPDAKRLSSKSEERESSQRQTRPSLSRISDGRRIFSSGSEDDLSSQRRKIEKRHPAVEPRISDEEDWESELRIRRKQFMEKLAAQQRDSFADEEELSSLRRRSSAEGRIALLKDPTADDNMDAWTISVGSRVAQLGSSQESGDADEDAACRRRREYREQAPPPGAGTQSEEEVIWDASRRRSYTSSSQVTSLEEEEDDVTHFNFVLTKDSRRKSLQDLSKLSQEESETGDTEWSLIQKEGTETLSVSATTGLYKRESIIKSQASEEDPEYLLPERPKLVQQEREHPFKKAWQMQKSRSEEDSYVIKESKEQTKVQTKSKEVNESSMEKVKEKQGGERDEDAGAFADDESESVMLTRSRSSDTEENTRTSSKSEELESASSESISSLEINKANQRPSEEDFLRSNWPSEDEQLEVSRTGPRSKSEETEWKWEQEET